MNLPFDRRITLETSAPLHSCRAVMRAPLQADASFRDVLVQVQKRLAAASHPLDVSFQEIVEPCPTDEKTPQRVVLPVLWAPQT